MEIFVWLLFCFPLSILPPPHMQVFYSRGRRRGVEVVRFGVATWRVLESRAERP